MENKTSIFAYLNGSYIAARETERAREEEREEGKTAISTFTTHSFC